MRHRKTRDFMHKNLQLTRSQVKQSHISSQRIGSSAPLQGPRRASRASESGQKTVCTSVPRTIYVPKKYAHTSGSKHSHISARLTSRRFKRSSWRRVRKSHIVKLSCCCYVSSLVLFVLAIVLLITMNAGDSLIVASTNLSSRSLI